MSRFIRLPHSAGGALVVGAFALASLVGSAAAQSPAPSAAPADSAAATHADSTAPVPKHKSRFGRFRHALGKGVSAVGAKTGVSKETVERVAITAATGGAGAALIDSKSGASGSGSSLGARIAGRALTDVGTAAERAHAKKSGASGPGAAAAPGAPAMPAMPALSASPHDARGAQLPAAAAADTQALQALQELSDISMRAANGDARAKHALDVLGKAMSSKTGELAALERRASAGDAQAAQQLPIREAAIARAAMDDKTP